jgi:formamidopyrimidine-DNA glycosylase
MPELPDIELYRGALEARLLGATFEGAMLKSPFLLRSVEPKLDDVYGREVVGIERLGKRLVFALAPEGEDEIFLVIHLMVAGRFKWSEKKDAKPPGRGGLAAFRFSTGTLLLNEHSKKKRASLHVVRGRDALNAGHDRGGLEVLDVDLETFKARLLEERHTIKRCMTDPRTFSGIGNAYSDEILHRAQLSPIKMNDKLTDDEIGRLYDCTRELLIEWTERLKEEVGDGFPGKVTAFRPEMAVHGKFKEPCPVCGTAVQRIVHAENETNYCPRCQTGGKVLADRSLSRLLKKDWPRSIDELERSPVMRGAKPAGEG